MEAKLAKICLEKSVQYQANKFTDATETEIKPFKMQISWK